MTNKEIEEALKCRYPFFIDGRCAFCGKQSATHPEPLVKK